MFRVDKKQGYRLFTHEEDANNCLEIIPLLLMQWIGCSPHQLSSKNLSVGEKLAMTEEFQEEVRLENEKKKLEGNSKGGKSNKEVSLQLECDLKNDNTSRSETWTDNQIAKKAGVGTGRDIFVSANWC